MSIRSILILFPHRRIGFTNGFFPSGFQPKFHLCSVYFVPHTLHSRLLDNLIILGKDNKLLIFTHTRSSSIQRLTTLSLITLDPDNGKYIVSETSDIYSIAALKILQEWTLEIVAVNTLYLVSPLIIYLRPVTSLNWLSTGSMSGVQFLTRAGTLHHDS
jgi:hypothetical protein